MLSVGMYCKNNNSVGIGNKIFNYMRDFGVKNF